MPSPAFLARGALHTAESTANTLQGETVIDLGSGAGFDVFQAAAKVGPSGKAIGVDMSDVNTTHPLAAKAND